MKIKNINTIFILIILSIVLPWFIKPGYMFLTDFVWGPHMKAVWMEAQYLLVNVVNMLSIFVPVEILQKLFITATIASVLFGGKKLAEQYTTNLWVIGIVSIFTLFNPFVYDRLLYGQVSIVFSYGLLLYGFGFFLAALRLVVQKISPVKDLLLGAVCFAFALQFSQHSLFFMILIFAALLIQALILKIKMYQIGKSLAVIFFIVGILNINWISAIYIGNSEIRYFVKEGISQSDLRAFATAGDGTLEAAQNVVMLSGFWGKDQFRYVDLTDVKDLWGRSFLILLPIILFGISFGLRKKEYRYMSVVMIITGLISFFLALGVKSGLSEKATYWLFGHVPYYKGLRETQKWVALLAIVYAFFLTFGLRALFETAFGKKHMVAIGLFMSAVAMMQAPYLVWGFSGQATPAMYPADWYEVDEIINKNCSEQQTLFLPWHLYMRFNFIERNVANPAPNFLSCPVISGTNMEWGGIYDNSRSVEGELVRSWISNKGFTSSLGSTTEDSTRQSMQEAQFNKLNIKYIILAKEVDWQTYDWLNNNPHIKLIREFENLLLYKIDDVLKENGGRNNLDI